MPTDINLSFAPKWSQPKYVYFRVSPSPDPLFEKELNYPIKVILIEQLSWWNNLGIILGMIISNQWRQIDLTISSFLNIETRLNSENIYIQCDQKILCQLGMVPIFVITQGISMFLWFGRKLFFPVPFKDQ